MQRIFACVALSCFALACGPSAGEPTAARDEKDKGSLIALDGLKSRTPAEWKEEKPANKLRFAQFRLPKKGEDKDDAQLLIFKGLGGDVQANVKRWKEQFIPPEGKTIEDVAKVEEIKIGGHPATLVDIQGTYLFKTRPIDTKSVKKPNYRMVAIHFEGPKEIYHLKLTGPAKTVEAYKKGFDEWLKNFK